MSCHEIKDLIHAFLDGELDLVRSLEVEDHLKGCPACSRLRQRHEALRTAMAGQSLYSLSQQGYHIVRWAEGGMECWAVSDVKMEDVQEFARLWSREWARTDAK